MNARPFENLLAAAWPPEAWRDVTVLAAVSGGADSVAMLRALAALKTTGAGRLVVGHFNHRLRPEAAEEARFVSGLSDQLGLACEFGEGNVARAAELQGDGLEAAAREQRYAFLQATAERIGARYVATAHTADDQAETILHRILRGTGVAGLGGMPRARPLSDAVTLIRPLLGIRRTEIRTYLAALGQAFCEDASNASLAYTRNRIRHDLLPRLAAEYNPEVVAALVRLGDTAREVQRIIEGSVSELLDRCVGFSASSSDRVVIDCDRLAGDERHLVRELFVAVWRQRSWPQQAMGFAEWDRLAELALSRTDGTAETVKQTFPGPVLAQKKGPELSLTRLD